MGPISMSLVTAKRIETFLSWHLEAGTPEFMRPEKVDRESAKNLLITIREALRELDENESLWIEIGVGPEGAG
tara:strand:+ start:1035 stop:1253 length:219 start_codon:yes stop_codon:yes gene_type:complete